jgi:hypothetical protein
MTSNAFGSDLGLQDGGAIFQIVVAGVGAGSSRDHQPRQSRADQAPRVRNASAALSLTAPFPCHGVFRPAGRLPVRPWPRALSARCARCWRRALRAARRSGARPGPRGPAAHLAGRRARRQRGKVRQPRAAGGLAWMPPARAPSGPRVFLAGAARAAVRARAQRYPVPRAPLPVSVLAATAGRNGRRPGARARSRGLRRRRPPRTPATRQLCSAAPVLSRLADAARGAAARPWPSPLSPACWLSWRTIPRTARSRLLAGWSPQLARQPATWRYPPAHGRALLRHRPTAARHPPRLARSGGAGYSCPAARSPGCGRLQGPGPPGHPGSWPGSRLVRQRSLERGGCLCIGLRARVRDAGRS